MIGLIVRCKDEPYVDEYELKDLLSNDYPEIIDIAMCKK